MCWGTRLAARRHAPPCRHPRRGLVAHLSHACRSRHARSAAAEPEKRAEEPSTSAPAEEETPRGVSGPQTTAIVTGAISILLGAAYIALVVALDSRGEILPPPPEAFMQ